MRSHELKRLLDFAGAVADLVVLAPLLMIASVMIRLAMGSPILFRQIRLGHKGEPFLVHKFRTMTQARDAQGDLLPDERRLTRLGRFLRSTSLDELPQLINVLRGEMSLVGPRPLLAEYKNLYTPEQWRRHEVLPGMAGPVLSNGRNALGWEDKFKLDVWYVDSWSVWLDFKILLLTALRVMRREGINAAGYATFPKFEGTRDSRPRPDVQE